MNCRKRFTAEGAKSHGGPRSRLTPPTIHRRGAEDAEDCDSFLVPPTRHLQRLLGEGAALRDSSASFAVSSRLSGVTSPAPRPARRGRDGEPTRQRLLRAGLELFTTTGFHGTTTPALAQRAGRVVSRDALMEAARGDVSVSERVVDVHVSHLRQKLGDDPKAPRRIKTVRGVGYLLVKDDS